MAEGTTAMAHEVTVGASLGASRELRFKHLELPGLNQMRRERWGNHHSDPHEPRDKTLRGVILFEGFLGFNIQCCLTQWELGAATLPGTYVQSQVVFINC